MTDATELMLCAEAMDKGEAMTTRQVALAVMCVAAIGKLQALADIGATIGPFEMVDDGKPNCILEAIITSNLEVRGGKR